MPRTFDSFDDMPQAFWTAVANDPHHVTPIENGSPVYDLDNLVVVSPDLHDRIHDRGSL